MTSLLWSSPPLSSKGKDYTTSLYCGFRDEHSPQENSSSTYTLVCTSWCSTGCSTKLHCCLVMYRYLYSIQDDEQKVLPAAHRWDYSINKWHPVTSLLSKIAVWNFNVAILFFLQSAHWALLIFRLGRLSVKLNSEISQSESLLYLAYRRLFAKLTTSRANQCINSCVNNLQHSKPGLSNFLILLSINAFAHSIHWHFLCLQTQINREL